MRLEGGNCVHDVPRRPNDLEDALGVEVCAEDDWGIQDISSPGATDIWSSSRGDFSVIQGKCRLSALPITANNGTSSGLHFGPKHYW